ncbi:MAG TPA: GNAT family N-acetyltransferase [Brevundimonas sp.]|nr:GNAT family N-acetyltransferase [Brevundimonas sp.]
MAAPHPLDAPILSSLTGRHSHFAVKRSGAYRYDPDYAVFAAVEDHSVASLAGLAELARLGDVALMDADAPSAGPSLELCSENAGVQMVVAGPPEAKPIDVRIGQLGEDDAGDMLALATLTEPGPFFAKTHCLGEFYGVREKGRLIAMAGERLKPQGFTEISGVCTHPDYQGQGLAAALVGLMVRRISERGETAFLHTYARNTGAIALYQRLGFSLRREVRMLRLTRTRH